MTRPVSASKSKSNTANLGELRRFTNGEDESQSSVDNRFFSRFFRGLLNSYTGLIGLVLVSTIVFSAIAADVIAPHDPNKQNLADSLLPPAWQKEGTITYLLGTDAFGRDLLSRIIFGSRISLLVGLTAVTVQGALGTLLGLSSGYYGGRLDQIIMRLADIQLAIPFLVLALALVAVLEANLRNLILALGISGWVSYGRVVRSEVLSIRERDFVEAARALGATAPRIIFRHIFPNASSAVTVIATLQVARMIIAEASLSFLGLGVQPPTPSLGRMVAEGRNYLMTAWWVGTFPGLTIFLIVLGINLLGDWLRDILDPTIRV